MHPYKIGDHPVRSYLKPTLCVCVCVQIFYIQRLEGHSYRPCTGVLRKKSRKFYTVPRPSYRKE